MKTEVYSWRVSTDLKMSLEREARRRRAALSAVLDMTAREWLNKAAPEMERKDSNSDFMRPHQSALGLSPAAMHMTLRRRAKSCDSV